MKLGILKNLLDREFNIQSNKENLADFAVTSENTKFVYPDFLAHRTGLMTSNSAEIAKVYSAVFITDDVVGQIRKHNNCLILTHHNFDYYEDERGLQPIRPDVFQILKETKNSVYVAHAPLDTHKLYGTSVCLADLCNIKTDRLFYDYFGAPTALIGHIEKMDFIRFAEIVKNAIKRPNLTLYRNIDYVQKIAVVAGGGDIPEILQHVYDAGCDTLLAGTIKQLWGLPFIQEGNRKFHV